MSESFPLLVPLPTPFTDDTVTISEVRVARLVRHYREQGMAGFVICTEAGEFLTLAHSERKEFLELVAREAGGLPIIVNITAFTTAAMVDLAQHAERHGARAVIFKAPGTLGLTSEEVSTVMKSLQRHAKLQVGFIAAPDKVAEALPAGATNFATALFSSAHSQYAVSKVGVTTEFECVEGVCTPFAMLGKDRTQTLIRRWEMYKSVAEGMWKLAGPMRLSRAMAHFLPFEIMVGRGPIQNLNDQAVQALRKLYDSTGL